MYRQLSRAEIDTLERQGCKAENWKNVDVSIAFSANNISNVQFAGNVQLGTQSGMVQIDSGILKPATIRNCYIENCVIGENVFFSNIGSLINYRIKNQVVIENLGSLVVYGNSTFGNGYEIDVLNEGGGRELPIFEKLSAQIAYLLVLYRHNKKLVEKLKNLINNYTESKKSSIGEIGEYSVIQNTKSIRNVNIGPYSKIIGASKLFEGTISSNEQAPVYIGEEVVAENFIVLSGSKIDGGAIVSNTFIGQGVKIGRQFSAENTTFFANSEAYHGEACSVFAGPYTVTHHKSTLLIAGMFSFYNAGSGSNQSNHMYKLGPVHQGIVERGSKTGSLSYMLWPCRIGAFSVVMHKHAGNFDTTSLPFSYISVIDGKSVVTPAMNLFTVGTARDTVKWPGRDRRKNNKKLDLINFSLFNPYIVQKIIDGADLLSRLYDKTTKTSEFAIHKGVHINRFMLRTSKRYYDLAVNVYLTQSIINKIKNTDLNSLENVRRELTPQKITEQNKWIDVSGMIVEKQSMDRLIDSICSEEIKSIEELLENLEAIHNKYEEMAYAWSVNLLKERMNIDVKNISGKQLAQLVSDWKTNAVKYKNMILKDAEKEFDQLSRIGFGIDGDEKENTEDFKAIRGTYDTNSFIVGLKNEVTRIHSEYEILIKQLEQMRD